MQHASRLGDIIREGFRAAFEGVKGVLDIRGDGLMVGIELDRPCSEMVQRALDAGLLINVTVDRVIRLLPPLVFSDAEAQQLVTMLSGLIREFLGE
jgi:acetylornithine aminotransferase